MKHIRCALGGGDEGQAVDAGSRGVDNSEKLNCGNCSEVRKPAIVLSVESRRRS